MASTVYWIRHPDHTDMFSQGYICVSKNTKKRFNAHKNAKENQHLKNAVQKYGFDVLIKQIVLISDETYCFDIEKKLRPTDQIGWNITAGGGNPPAKKNSGSFKIGIVPWNKGIPMDDETKARVSAAKQGQIPPNKGKPMSDEAKEKLSTARKGKLPFPDAVEKMAAANRGKKRPDWVVRKILEAKKRNKELRDLSKEATQ
jgi:hypothetical protein